MFDLLFIQLLNRFNNNIVYVGTESGYCWGTFDTQWCFYVSY